MARSLSSSKITIKTTGQLRNTLTDSSVSSISQPALDFSSTLSSGVNANMANRAWQVKEKAIALGEQEIIDLNTFTGTDIGGGDGNDALGQAMDLEEIVLLIIQNDNAVGTAGELEINASSSQGWPLMPTYSSALGNALRGQGVLVMYQPAEQGFDVTADTDRITLKATGGAVNYSMYVLGRHDDEESSSSSSSLSSSSLSSSSSSSSTSGSMSKSSLSSSSVSDSSSSLSSSSQSSSSLS